MSIDQPRRSAPQARVSIPADPEVSEQPPTRPAYKNQLRTPPYLAHIRADPQFQSACMTRSAPQIPRSPPPQARTPYTSILRQITEISSFYSSPAALTLLTYYRSAPHLPSFRSAPQIRLARKFTRPLFHMFNHVVFSVQCGNSSKLHFIDIVLTILCMYVSGESCSYLYISGILFVNNVVLAMI